MHRLRASPVRALLFLGGITACIDDPLVMDDQFALSQDDAALLGLTIWRQALEAQLEIDIDGNAQPASSAPSLAPVVSTFSDTTSVACALSGEVEKILDVTATVDAETGEVQLDAAMTLTHDACREDLEGETYSFYGSPSIVASVSLGYDGIGGQTLGGAVEGSVVVITQGAPLLCDVSLSAGPAPVVDGSVTYPLEGHFCGESFDDTVTEQIDP